MNENIKRLNVLADMKISISMKGSPVRYDNYFLKPVAVALIARKFHFNVSTNNMSHCKHKAMKNTRFAEHEKYT